MTFAGWSIQVMPSSSSAQTVEMVPIFNIHTQCNDDVYKTPNIYNDDVRG